MATRHQVRQAVVSLLYAKDMGNEMDDFKNEFLEEKKIRNAQFKYANEPVSYTHLTLPTICSV